MKNQNLYLLSLCLWSFFNIVACEILIKSISFAQGTNLFTNDTIQRDGKVIAKLNTNEVTTICNYNFNEISAGIICKTLGFPAQALSIINSNTNMINGSVLLANIQCTGLESNISYCVNSGRSVQPPPCSNHIMDVHVYCLQTQVPQVVTPNDGDTICNKTSSQYSFDRLLNKINVGLPRVNIRGTFYPICNDDYSLTLDIVKFVCSQLCYSNKIESVVMPYLNISIRNDSVRPNCIKSGCQTSDLQSCFTSSYIAGIKCGDEPQFIESPPNVKCTNQNMTVIWPKQFFPSVNYTLVSLVTQCDSSTKNNSIGDAEIYIPFNDCTPTIIGSSNYVNFSYTIKREYDPTYSLIAKTLTVSCSFPKNISANNTFGFKGVTNIPINSTTNLKMEMTFYSDSGYSSQLLSNAQISNDKDLFVKVNVINPPKNLSLILINCHASLVNDFTNIYTNNSVVLINNVCPNSNYNVVISPFSSTEVRFQFSPYKTISQSTVPLYVLCKTSLCYLRQDGNCPSCRNRKKRSAKSSLEEYEVYGVLFWS